MSTKKIGIVGWSTGDNSFGTTKAYLHFLSMFGNVRILTPRNDIDTDLDLVVMPGGRDTLPTNYDQVPGYYNTDPDQYKEHFMKKNLPKYIESKIPIFGICLGFQMICTHFGGKLDQNIPIGTHGYSGDDKGNNRGELVNDLIFSEKFLNVERKMTIGKKNAKIKVCSLHHQGIYVDDVPGCLDVVAYTKDNIAEFILHKELAIGGCQSHPEEDWCPLSIKMIETLLLKSPNKVNEQQGVSSKAKE